jgi:diaminopimelate decarboxylase
MNPRDKAWLAEMAISHPTPFGVLFPRVAQARYFELVDSFRGVAKTLHVCYSVKTNPNTAILNVLNKMESGFECVSLRELHAVSSFSTPKIFNSCASSDKEIQEALSQNAFIILDSLSHAEQVSRLSEKKPLNVGVRIRFDSHRFGFSPSEIKSLLPRFIELGLNVTLVHAHPGTNCSVSQYCTFVSHVAVFLEDFPNVHAVDLGGGFPGKTTLVERKEGLDSYVKIIREQLGSYLKTCALYLESGRFLVEDSLIFVSKIMHVKKGEEQSFALLDAGINVLPRISMSPFRFFALSETGEKKEHFRLGGPLMFGSDEFGQIHAKLGKGDLIAVENVGAYCMEMAWTLSRELPKIVVVE